MLSFGHGVSSVCLHFVFGLCVCYFIVDNRVFFGIVFFLMIRRPPRSTLDRSSAASDVYKRQWKRRAVPVALVELDKLTKDLNPIEALRIG